MRPVSKSRTTPSGVRPLGDPEQGRTGHDNGRAAQVSVGLVVVPFAPQAVEAEVRCATGHPGRGCRLGALARLGSPLAFDYAVAAVASRGSLSAARLRPSCTKAVVATGKRPRRYATLDVQDAGAAVVGRPSTAGPGALSRHRRANSTVAAAMGLRTVTRSVALGGSSAVGS